MCACLRTCLLVVRSQHVCTLHHHVIFTWVQARPVMSLHSSSSGERSIVGISFGISTRSPGGSLHACLVSVISGGTNFSVLIVASLWARVDKACQRQPASFVHRLCQWYQQGLRSNCRRTFLYRFPVGAVPFSSVRALFPLWFHRSKHCYLTISYV